MKLLNESKINQIFKGDQNLFWDALITDSSVSYHLNLEESRIQFIPFIHDEKFGAPDQNLIHCLEKPIDSYFISEDYADSAGDATYLNIDTSFGIFYFPVVSESRLKEFSLSIKTLAKSYTKRMHNLDLDFIHQCSKFGLFLSCESIIDLGMGDIPNQEEINCFFELHPDQRMYYLFTRAIGRYGIAPVKDNNILMSSVYLNDSNVYENVCSLLRDYLLAGVIKQSNTEEHKIIEERFANIAKSLQESKQNNASIADLESNITQEILSHLHKEYQFKLTRSSQILSCPEKYGIDHFYLSAFLEMNDKMTTVYNDSLNQTKMSIQRIRKGETTVNLPFYINREGKDGRYSRTELYFNHISRELNFKQDADYVVYQKNKKSFISGKAIPFLNEFRLDKKLIALPEHGSKYTPACDTFIKNSRKIGLDIPEAKILRISLHFLDQLGLAGNRMLILPKILIPFFGKEISCLDFSTTWRSKTIEIKDLLDMIKRFVCDGRETKLAQQILQSYLRKEEKSLIYQKFMDEEMLSVLIELTQDYHLVLIERSKKNISLALKNKYETITFKIKLLIRYYMQQLIQIHDGLLYMNDRPYSLAIYLMFGPDFWEEMIKNVTFRLETG